MLEVLKIFLLQERLSLMGIATSGDMSWFGSM